MVKAACEQVEICLKVIIEFIERLNQTIWSVWLCCEKDIGVAIEYVELLV